MITAQQKRLKGDNTFTTGHVEAYKPYLDKLHSLLKELREFARREFQ
jgi:hypothetical protein